VVDRIADLHEEHGNVAVLASASIGNTEEKIWLQSHQFPIQLGNPARVSLSCPYLEDDVFPLDIAEILQAIAEARRAVMPGNHGIGQNPDLDGPLALAPRIAHGDCDDHQQAAPDRPRSLDAHTRCARKQLACSFPGN
jgi:hypothetical protein